MFTQHSLQGDDLTLGFAEGPVAGPPLVLLHGVTRCWQDFAPLFPSLSSRWHLHALDFRGHGSSKPGDDYLVMDYVRDALWLLKSRLTRPAVVYGHSLGAMVAAAVAAQAPELVRGVVLEDPPFETLGRGIAQTQFHSLFTAMLALAERRLGVVELAREMAEIRVTTPGAAGEIRLGDVRDATTLRFGAKCLAGIDPAVLRPLIAGRWLDGYDRRGILSQIQCPVLLLQADDAVGGMLPDAAANEVATLVGDCTHVRLAGVGHLAHWTHTETVVRHVLGFLESLPAAAPKPERPRMHIKRAMA